MQLLGVFFSQPAGVAEELDLELVLPCISHRISSFRAKVLRRKQILAQLRQSCAQSCMLSKQRLQPKCLSAVQRPWGSGRSSLSSSWAKRSMGSTIHPSCTAGSGLVEEGFPVQAVVEDQQCLASFSQPLFCPAHCASTLSCRAVELVWLKIACSLCSENGWWFLWLGEASQEETLWENRMILLKGAVLCMWSLVRFIVPVIVDWTGSGARKFWFLQKELVCGQDGKDYWVIYWHLRTLGRKISNQFPSAYRVDCSGRRVASLDVDGVIKVWSFNPIMQTTASSISKSPLLSLEWATKRDRLVSSLRVEAQGSQQMIWDSVAMCCMLNCRQMHCG